MKFTNSLTFVCNNKQTNVEMRRLRIELNGVMKLVRQDLANNME